MDEPRNRLVKLTRVWADALGYALIVTAIAWVVALVGGIATGGGFVRGKIFLFVIGWLLMSTGTAKLWPSSPYRSSHGSRNVLGLSLGSDTDENHSTTAERDDDSRELRENMQKTDSGDDDLGSLSEQDDSRLQQLVRKLPPNRWLQPPRPEDRLADGSKLFLASLFVFGLSYVMERFFGVV